MEISFGDEKHGQQIWVICLLCDLPPNFSPKKILYGLFLDRRLRVQNLMKNLSSFLRTGLMKGASLRKFRMRFAGVWFGTSLSFNRWSFGERRTEKGYLPMVWSRIFIDTSVNFDVYHRVFGRRLGVDSSFTSGVRVKTTTTYTPSATIRTSRRTVAVERRRKASHSFVSQQQSDKRRP